MSSRRAFLLGIAAGVASAVPIFTPCPLPAPIPFETMPALGGDVVIDPVELREMYEKYVSGQVRYICLSGMSVRSSDEQLDAN